MTDEPARVVLDCDTRNEVDDQFAIAHALGRPDRLEVLGVVSVHNTTADGPGSRDLYQREAERVVDLCRPDVACVPGAERPMEDAATPVPSPGLEFLAEAAGRGPLVVVATGPATDVASLLLTRPELRERLRVVWLGGFADEETYERHKRGDELNGRADIAAWRCLLEQPVDLLQVPGWSGPHELLVDVPEFPERLRRLERPVVGYLADLLEEWVASHDQGPAGRGRKRLWDLACVAAVTDPGSLRVEPLAVPAVDAAGAHDFSRRGRRVRAVTGLQPRRILSGCLEALEHHPGPRGS